MGNLSNYPNGLNATIRGVPIGVTHPGKIFYVSNSTVTPATADGLAGANVEGLGTYQRPFSTIDFAVGQCVASRGDVIFVMPGHAETVTATSIALDVAGVSIVGLGFGSLRPTLTFGAAAATIQVTAANVSVTNILHVANFADVATAYTNNAGPEFSVEGCEFRDTSSILNFLSCVTTTVSVNADGLNFSRNKVFGLGTTAATTPIVVAGTISRPTINDNRVVLAILNNTSALLAHGALVVSNLEMIDNKVFRPNSDTSAGAILITTSATTNTGMVINNHVKTVDVAGMLLVTAGSAYGVHENYVSGTADASGLLIPAADSDGS
jgi:hypothetical protein